ncbi:MAG: NUDIX hydrolase [Propionibacteriaceae bacterium]|nr:NUDIX hydrolase [Propionibacteriaceae bacterium]
MSGSRRILNPAELTDQPATWPIAHRKQLGIGAIATFVNDTVVTPDGKTIERQFTIHPGAVGIIAWNDADQIAVVKQYRHPIGYELIEPPAGLLDQDNEDFLTGAQRELAEEAGLAAGRWRILVDVFASPGAGEESVRIYLATELTETAAPDGFKADAEESAMEVCWAARAQLVDAIFAGKIQNPTMVTGILALETARNNRRLEQLRAADSVWEARAVKAERVNQAH